MSCTLQNHRLGNEPHFDRPLQKVPVLVAGPRANMGSQHTDGVQLAAMTSRQHGGMTAVRDRTFSATGLRTYLVAISLQLRACPRAVRCGLSFARPCA